MFDLLTAFCPVLSTEVKTSAEDQCDDAGLLQSKAAAGDEKLELDDSWPFFLRSRGSG